MNKYIERLLRRELYKKSFYEFVKTFWQYADPSKFVDSDLVEYYCEVFQYMARSWWNYQEIEIDTKRLKGKIIDVRENKHNLNLVVPPRHSKSMIFNVLGPIWLWLLAPIKAVSVSHTGQLASQMNSKRHQVINSPLFREIFQEIQLVTNSTSFLKDSRGGELYSINRNAFTGYGGDVIINDDLTNAESARKDKEEMNNAWSYYQNTMPSRINDINKCIIINIQQRLAPNDITGHIMNDKFLRSQYTFITLPAIFNETTHLIFPISGKIKTFYKGDVLWRERFGNYQKLRHQVGETVFETQYLQNPIASDRTTIKDEMIIEKNILEVPSYEDAEIVYASHDFPIKDKESSDFVGSVLAYKVNNTIYIKDCLEKKMAFVKSVEYVKRLSLDFPGIIQIIEDKANGSPIIQQLQEEISGIQAYNPKTQSKVQRLESASLYMESKNVVFVKDEWNEQTKKYELSKNLLNLKQRLLQFPFVKNDDIVDAFSMLILYVFLDKRNNVYLRSFTSENIVEELPNNIHSTIFVNKENNYFKISEIGIDYSNNILYVIRDAEIKCNNNEIVDHILELNSTKEYYVDVSNIPLNIIDKRTIQDRYVLTDTFNESTDILNTLFSTKSVKVLKTCKRTISDIERFKWLVNNNEDIKYITENDGFIKNIRVAVRYLGLII